MLSNQVNKFYCAIYLRLSREDRDESESNSIRNQRELLSDFIKKQPNMVFVDEYVDDGYSGTNFERPAFQHMMEDADKGIINCIIVKDLSRLGRNYIETGKYIERIFPLLGVRFISVNDHYDSFNESNDVDQIIVPFKNLINDAYSRDISTKVRSQLDIKRKKGLYIGSFAPYGYTKDPENKNHLIIDEYAANVIQQIFKMKLEGYSAERIAEHLNKMGVLPPTDYKRKCGENFNSGFRSCPNPNWSVATILRILKNEIYTGTMVQGKSRRVNHKVKSLVPIEEENWIRVPDTHEAIIDKQTFADVQQLLHIDTRTSPKQEKVYLFSGFIRCGDCGQNMTRRETPKKEKKYYYYQCSSYKKKCGCSSHLISEKTLEKVVLKSVQTQMALLVDMQVMIQNLEQLPLEQFSAQALKKQVEEINEEMERYRKIREKLYVDYVEQVVSKEEYRELDERFSMKEKMAEETLENLRKKKEEMMNVKMELSSWIESLKQYGEMKELNRRLVVSLIDRIIVYSKDQIEIRFKHQDEIDFVIKAMEHQRKLENAR